jgi:hypothetical protein
MLRMDNLESHFALSGFWCVSFASAVRLDHVSVHSRRRSNAESRSTFRMFRDLPNESLPDGCLRWKQLEACRTTNRMRGFTPGFMHVPVLGESEKLRPAEKFMRSR